MVVILRASGLFSCVTSLCLILVTVLQKRLTLQNQYTCQMNFSTPKDPKDKQMIYRVDWTCVKVGFAVAFNALFPYFIVDSLVV